MTKNTGGPAFAVAELANIKWEGMTLRDYFAAKALQCYMVNEVWNANTYKAAAKVSYAVADAMLEARKE
jgi:ATP-dependent phosphoenolpyruvate carboxykinase